MSGKADQRKTGRQDQTDDPQQKQDDQRPGDIGIGDQKPVKVKPDPTARWKCASPDQDVIIPERD